MSQKNINLKEITQLQKLKNIEDEDE